MKLTLVHDWLTGMRGGEKCLEVLCRRYPQARLMTLLHVPGSTSPWIERMQITTSALQRVPGAARHYRYLLPLMPRAMERLQAPPDTELVLSLSHAVAKGFQPPPGVPHICYCFTPMRYAWHLREEYFRDPATGEASQVISGRICRGSLTLARNLLLDRIREWDRYTSSRVTHFVAISQAVARRIAECYGRGSTVIYPPVDTEFFTPGNQPREDFYFCVSALVPYKRLDLAVDACTRLKRKLVIIGDGPERAKLAARAGPSVTLLGRRSDVEIRDHLRRCRALLFPGQEDFGIVPVEAQACGTPVIALARDGALETVIRPTGKEPGSGVFFEQSTTESLIDAMLSWERNATQVCPRRARQQALRFTRGRFETELVDFLVARWRQRSEPTGSRPSGER